MAKTKAEIRKFLNSQVGKKVNSKAGIYNGQCVSLIKALLEFLGAPDPYKARGNAKDYGDTILREGIAKNGRGWLNVCINRDMGRIYEPSLGKYVTYGHIWIDLKDEANYEQNGAQALHTTKGTRPYSQTQQVVNLDKYIKADTPKPPKEDKVMVTEQGLAVIYRFLLGTGISEYGRKNRLGKQTFDEAYKGIRNSEAYKKKLAEFKKTKQVDLNQLPESMRNLIGMK